MLKVRLHKITMSLVFNNGELVKGLVPLSLLYIFRCHVQHTPFILDTLRRIYIQARLFQDFPVCLPQGCLLSYWCYYSFHTECLVSSVERYSLYYEIGTHIPDFLTYLRV